MAREDETAERHRRGMNQPYPNNNYFVVQNARRPKSPIDRSKN